MIEILNCCGLEIKTEYNICTMPENLITVQNLSRTLPIIVLRYILSVLFLLCFSKGYVFNNLPPVFPYLLKSISTISSLLMFVYLLT